MFSCKNTSLESVSIFMIGGLFEELLAKDTIFDSL